jgi:chromosome condensin MukBEF MukE localization factor
MNEVKITNFSTMANLYRNMHRPMVDEIFTQKESYEEKLKKAVEDKDVKAAKAIKAKIESLDKEARDLWRQICIEAEKLI